MSWIDTQAEAERMLELLERGALGVASVLERLRELAAPTQAGDLFDALEEGRLDVRSVFERLQTAPKPAEQPAPQERAVPPHKSTPPSAPVPSAKIALRAPVSVDADTHAPQPQRQVRLRLAAAASVDRDATRSPEAPATTGSAHELVSVERHGAHVAIVTMRDIEHQNMLTGELSQALQKAFDTLVRDDSVRVVVLHGEDPWFSAGGSPETVAMVRDGTVRFTDRLAYRLPLDFPLPTVAAMSGNAIGGGLVMGLYADAIVMADDRKYSANFLRHSITPGVGATHMVPHRLGELLGAEMLYSARLYPGRELRERGAPIEFLPAAEVLPRALARAEQFAAHPRELLVRLKGRLTERLRHDVNAAIEQELRLHKEAAPGRSPAQREPSPLPPERPDAPLYVVRDAALCIATLNRPLAGNSLNATLIEALHTALDQAEADPACRMFVLRGCQGTFCSGMDLEELLSAPPHARGQPSRRPASPYMDLLGRLASTPLLVVTAADGKVLAGGVGLAAASDLVLVSAGTTFALSEALFGMLPAQVMPYLIRRVGFQTAYQMTLTAAPLAAADAERRGLADEVCDDLDARLRWYARRSKHIQRETIADAKRYFRKMWLIDDTMEATAVDEFTRLVRAPRVLDQVRAFLGTSTPHEEAP